MNRAMGEWNFFSYWNNESFTAFCSWILEFDKNVAKVVPSFLFTG